MLSQIAKYKLHRRIALMLLFTAVLGGLFYFAFVVTIVNKLEQTMLATLVGHEIDELVTELVKDPDIRMPNTASVQAYLLSRENEKPIPEFLKELESDIHEEIMIEDRVYHAAVIDLHNDIIYMSFEITAIYKYRWLLLVMLIGGGVVTVVFLMVSGVWLSRKFLGPVSDLAQEVSNLDPNQRKVRIEKNYKDYEVGLIAKSFDQFMDKMDDFVTREQSFTEAISHELRTPVSVIGTSVDLLELKGITEQQKSVFNRIKVSNNYMGKVIDSLLFFARHIHDKTDDSLPVISLSDVCQDVLNQYEGLANEKNIALKLTKKSNTKVRILGNHIEIILSNLVRNAINNTQQGSIDIEITENGFSVTDTGQGMDDEQMEDILERCKKQPIGRTSGLGLYLVSNICKFYGLEIDVQSSPGEGSRFIISFSDHMIQQEVREPVSA